MTSRRTHTKIRLVPDILNTDSPTMYNNSAKKKMSVSGAAQRSPAAHSKHKGHVCTSGTNLEIILLKCLSIRGLFRSQHQWDKYQQLFLLEFQKRVWFIWTLIKKWTVWYIVFFS